MLALFNSILSSKKLNGPRLQLVLNKPPRVCFLFYVIGSTAEANAEPGEGETKGERRPGSSPSGGEHK